MSLYSVRRRAGEGVRISIRRLACGRPGRKDGGLDRGQEAGEVEMGGSKSYLEGGVNRTQ